VTCFAFFVILVVNAVAPMIPDTMTSPLS